MAFKTWSALDILAASDVMTYLMKQVVITCTAATHPASPVEGMTLYETDTDKFLVYTGAAYVEFARTSAWTVYVPTWTALTVGNAIVDCAYLQQGKTITYQGLIQLGTTSSISGTVKVSLPIAARTFAGGVGRRVGTGSYEDVGVQMYGGYCSVTTAATVLELHHLGAGNLGHVNATNPFTFATGDSLYWTAEYETA